MDEVRGRDGTTSFPGLFPPGNEGREVKIAFDVSHKYFNFVQTSMQ